MPRKEAPLRINQFVGGLNTEANPLSFPINASSDELNLTLETNGVRSQRSGFDVEEGYNTLDTGVVAKSNVFIGRSEFLWDNAGGDSSVRILVVQIGNYIGFHKVGTTNTSAATLYSEKLSDDAYENDFDYAVVEGLLVVTTGLPEFRVYEYDPILDTISVTTQRLKVRDFWETDGEVSSVKYNSIDKIDTRPTTANYEYLYGLRNGTYNLPHLNIQDNRTISDPISKFRNVSDNGSSKYPSYADNLITHLQARTSYTNLPTVDRYIQDDDFKTLPSNTRAPRGYFIIDALDRGSSRDTAYDKLLNQHPELTVGSTGGTLQADTTQGGINVCSDYAGRVWFGGFSSEVVDGYDNSPLLGSYIFFSQIVENKKNVNKCYQQANPTDPYDNELVATDGGYIRLSGAYDIRGMLSLGPYLLVFAKNGVWKVSGVDGNSFTATGFSVSKLTDYGCVSGDSIVQVGDEAVYWGDEAIYFVTQDKVSGSYVVQDITENTIKGFYDNITSTDKETVVGYHDTINSSIRWLYGTELQNPGNTKELVLNLKFNAFIPITLPDNGEVVGPLACTSGVPQVSDINYSVTNGGVQVTDSGADVWVTQLGVELNAFSSFYTIILSTNTTITYTFGGYRDDTKFDWVRREGTTGYLPPSYLVTGAATGGQAATRKDVKYLNIFFPNKGDTAASCWTSSMWDWSTDINSGKWSSTREAYRYKSKDQYLSVLHARVKVRGSGNAISFKFENDGTNPLYLYGWEFDLSTKGDE